MEAAIIYLQDIPLGQTLNTPHSLIALWVVEPILLLFQHGPLYKVNKSNAAQEEDRL